MRTLWNLGTRRFLSSIQTESLKAQTEGLSQPGGVLEIKSLGRAAIFSKETDSITNKTHSIMAEVIKSTKNGATGLWTVLVSVGGVVIPVIGYNFDAILRFISRVFGIAY